MGALTIPAQSWQAADWQRLWMSIWRKGRPWRSLALVPAGPGVPGKKLMQIAVTLANAGSLYVKRPIHVADATGMVMHQQIESFCDELARYVSDTEHMVVALPALSDNGASLALAKAADCALLCIVRGEMLSADARKTVSQVGARHFLGSALFSLADDEPEPVAPTYKL
jgi:hypothetical protein